MNISKILFLFLFLGTILSCDSSQRDQTEANNSESALEVVDCQFFKDYISSNENFLLLDVRTQEEVDNGMIDGAQHIDFYANTFSASLDQLDKEQTVLVYCARGGRSNKAANQMIEMGFSKVYDLNGGYGAWTSCE